MHPLVSTFAEVDAQLTKAIDAFIQQATSLLQYNNNKFPIFICTANQEEKEQPSATLYKYQLWTVMG